MATEAAGEGINLQFCWLMINFDIPWNPVRLEQRVGRIHRYGQEHDCLIINFVAPNTREGRVLQKLLDGWPRSARTWAPIRSSTWWARSSRRTCWSSCSGRCTPGRPTSPASRTASSATSARSGSGRSPNRPWRAWPSEGLNLSAIVGQSAEAKERRLVPEVVEQFFVEAAPEVGLHPKATAQGQHVYRIGECRASSCRSATGRNTASAASAASTAASSSTRPCSAGPDAGMGHAGASALRGGACGSSRPASRPSPRGAVFYDLNRTRRACSTCSRPRSRTAGADAPPPAVRRRNRRRADGRPRADHLPGSYPGAAGAHGPVPMAPLPDRQRSSSSSTSERSSPGSSSRRATGSGGRAGRRACRNQPQRPDRPPESAAGRPLNRQVEGQTVPGLDGLIAQAEQHLDELNNRLRRATPGTGAGTPLHRGRHHPPRPGLGPAASRAGNVRVQPDGPGRRDRADRRAGRARHEGARAGRSRASNPRTVAST